MVREIKFRGKRIDTGEWVYGDLLHNVDCIKIREKETDIHSVAKSYIVVPKTVGQFTGLKDKNGKEIYEGDIINMLNNFKAVVHNGEHHAYCPVDDTWMKSIGFYVRSRKLPGMPLGPTEEYAEIIGNIHDNPKLSEEIE